MHGQFIWYELTTPDVEASKTFYPRFMGWGTQAFDNDYMMFTTGGAPAAGIFKLNDEMKQHGVPPNWMPYVESSNVDDTVRKATPLGARLLAGPQDIPGTGRFAVLADPQGAAFGVYTPKNSSGAWDGTNILGRASWHELMTTDYQKAFDFYRALFGWDKTTSMDMGGGAMYQLYGKGGKDYGGMYNRMAGMEGIPPNWLLYFHVRDVGKAVEAATKAGARVVRPQRDIPGGGSIAILTDPHGAAFALHHANPVAAAAPAAKPAAKKAAPAKKAVKSAAPAKKAVKKGVKKAVKKAAARKVAKKKPAKTKRAAKSDRRPAAKKAASRKRAAPGRPTVKRAAKKTTRGAKARRR